MHTAGPRDPAEPGVRPDRQGHRERAAPPTRTRARLRLGALAAIALLLAAGIYALTADTAKGPARSAAGHAARARHASASKSTQAHPALVPRPPVAPLLVTPAQHPSARWVAVAEVHGVPAAWLAQRSGVTLMRFDQSLVHLTLHAGASDGGASGWRYGDHITPREIHLLLAAVNGGFKLSYRDVGFAAGSHVAVELKAGLASIVTYTDGKSDIGAWREGVPTARKSVFSVLQNQRLLVDRGVAAASVSGCIVSCWGETIGSRTSVARSGLGITANGQLLWAAGEQLLPAELASALIRAGAVRALELDINPAWVAGYLYVHHRGGPLPVPLVPGQIGIAGKLLEPDSRDFLAFVAN
jgi:hypothetical protein